MSTFRETAPSTRTPRFSARGFASARLIASGVPVNTMRFPARGESVSASGTTSFAGATPAANSRSSFSRFDGAAQNRPRETAAAAPTPSIARSHSPASESGSTAASISSRKRSHEPQWRASRSAVVSPTNRIPRATIKRARSGDRRASMAANRFSAESSPTLPVLRQKPTRFLPPHRNQSARNVPEE